MNVMFVISLVITNVYNSLIFKYALFLHVQFDIDKRAYSNPLFLLIYSVLYTLL